MKKNFAGKGFALALLAMMLAAGTARAQKSDSLRRTNQIKGAVTLTNNGISVIPTFTLGKPAAMFDLTLGRRLTFEPQLRFSMKGQPWAFIFWWRYKVVQEGRFRLNVGAHPAFAFFARRSEVSTGVMEESLVVKRFVAAEIAPHYYVTKNTNVGFYYLQGHGVDDNSTRLTHFVTVNANFNRVALSRDVFMKIQPQLYYLKMDDLDGYYFTATVTLLKDNFPLSVQSIINETIETRIPADKDFLWNVSLIYSFGKNYVENR